MRPHVESASTSIAFAEIQKKKSSSVICVCSMCILYSIHVCLQTACLLLVRLHLLLDGGDLGK